MWPSIICVYAADVAVIASIVSIFSELNICSVACVFIFIRQLIVLVSSRVPPISFSFIEIITGNIPPVSGIPFKMEITLSCAMNYYYSYTNKSIIKILSLHMAMSARKIKMILLHFSISRMRFICNLHSLERHICLKRICIIWNQWIRLNCRWAIECWHFNCI